MRRIFLPVLGAGALMFGASAALAQPGLNYRTDDWRPPTPGEQHDMHTGAANTNGSSSVAYDRYGAHADGFPKIRLADNSGFEGGRWRHDHQRRHHPVRRDNDGY